MLAARLIICNVVLLAPVLFLERRWRLPFGTVTTVWLPAIALAGAETEGRNPGILLTFEMWTGAAIVAGVVGWLAARCPDAAGSTR